MHRELTPNKLFLTISLEILALEVSSLDYSFFILNKCVIKRIYCFTRP